MVLSHYFQLFNLPRGMKPCWLILMLCLSIATAGENEISDESWPRISTQVSELVNVTESSNSTRSLARFTQAWSPGHAGTRFLASLFAKPVLGSPEKHCGDAVFWNERDLELGELKRCRCSHQRLQQYISRQKQPWWRASQWYGSEIKAWNEQNRTDLLRLYLAKRRVPALQEFFHTFPRLRHMVQFGHTAVFFDLRVMFAELSAALNVSVVRIRRQRLKVAQSFAYDGGHRPGPCYYKRHRMGIVTCPEFPTALLRPSAGVWQRWSSLQQHLWFADEVEAQWQRFRAAFPAARVFTVSFGPDDQLSAESVEALAAFLEVKSPARYMRSTARKSHLRKGGGPRGDSDLRQAEEYAQTAPWCRQNSLSSDFDIDCDPHAL